VRKRDANWNTRFGSFVSNFGVPGVIHGLEARGIRLSNQSVYHWIRGTAAPRPDVAQALVDLSGGALDLGAVYGHRHELAAGVRDAVVEESKSSKR
jgi:hypothetical protein